MLRKPYKKQSLSTHIKRPSKEKDFLEEVLTVLNDTRKALNLRAVKTIKPGKRKNSECPISTTLGLKNKEIEIIHSYRDGIGVFVHSNKICQAMKKAWGVEAVKVNEWDTWFLPLPDVLQRFVIAYDCYALPELVEGL